MPEQDLETQEREIAEVIYHQVDEALYLCDASKIPPVFPVTIGEIQCSAEISRRVNSYNNLYIQISLDVTPLYRETENKLPLVFFIFEKKYLFGIGQMEETENGTELRFPDIYGVQTILQLIGRNLPDINEAILNLFLDISNQIYNQRPGSIFWDNPALFSVENPKMVDLDSLIESANALLELQPETHNCRIERDESDIDSEIGAIINLQSIELYRLPESEGRDLVIKIELLQSGHIRTDIVLRFDERDHKSKVWMINTTDAETIVKARDINLEQAQTELTSTALLHLKSILSQHNLPKTEDGIIALLQQKLSDELNRTEISKKMELTGFENKEDFNEIFNGYYRKEVERIRSLIRQYDLILQKMEKGNSAYNFYQWKICCAYAEIDYLRLWYELTRNRSEFGPVRNNYLSAVEIADTLDEKREIAKRWQMKTGSLRLRKYFAMSRRSRELLRGIGEV